jgi:hypothetical protein
MTHDVLSLLNSDHFWSEIKLPHDFLGTLHLEMKRKGDISPKGGQEEEQ